MSGLHHHKMWLGVRTKKKTNKIVSHPTWQLAKLELETLQVNEFDKEKSRGK